MIKTDRYYNEVWRVNCILWKHFYPKWEEKVDRPNNCVLEMYLQADIEQAIYDSVDIVDAKEWILTMLMKSSFADEILNNVSLEKAYMAVVIRKDFHSALKSVKHGRELASKLSYSFSGKDLMELAKLHKGNKCRKKIEQLLTSCNFHSEVGRLVRKEYDYFLGKGEIA